MPSHREFPFQVPTMAHGQAEARSQGFSVVGIELGLNSRPGRWPWVQPRTQLPSALDPASLAQALGQLSVCPTWQGTGEIPLAFPPLSELRKCPVASQPCPSPATRADGWEPSQGRPWDCWLRHLESILRHLCWDLLTQQWLSSSALLERFLAQPSVIRCK